MSSSIEAPPLWMMALESRAPFEHAIMRLSMPFRRLLPKGDGHHVIVLPGFTADDRSTRSLRKILGDIGYEAHGWELGANMGPMAETLDGLTKLLERVSTKAEASVSLVGWSLGGLFARELARANPELIRQVITLGSPIQMVDRDSSAVQGMWNALKPLHSDEFKMDKRAAYRPHLEVPTSSIYSRTDGVVNWRASLVRQTDQSENIRVYGSHCGLGFNTSVIYAMADRLAQPDGEWKPFKVPLVLRGHYPSSHKFDFNRIPEQVFAS